MYMVGDQIASPARDNKRTHIRKADEISSVFDFKCRASSNHFIALAKPNTRDYPRLAIMVAKKTDRRAVRRNYMRRVFREYFRRNRLNIGQIDIVVRITKSFKKQDFADINQEIDVIFTKLQKCHAS